MVKELVHDSFFLAQKSSDATADDLHIAKDLLDALIFHKEGCVGMAANMGIVPYKNCRLYTN